MVNFNGLSRCKLYDFIMCMQNSNKSKIEFKLVVAVLLTDIKIEEFVNSRAGELSAIHAALLSKASDSTRTALQLLPRHLRRRASSHNIKRLPHRLHDLALRQVELTTLSLHVMELLLWSWYSLYYCNCA